MKITSTCEREFVVNCIGKKQKRLDGRNLLDGRTLEIAFGQERGCCMVLQGNTRILAQVSSEITEPKQSKPTEGILHVNFELSAMAAPEIKGQTRASDESVEAQRALERCIRDSKCVDLESLCIASGSKVWTVRVDVHTLNDDGNLIECSSIAAISALAHFRYPNVAAMGNEATMNSPEKYEQVPLNLYHMPIIVNLALYMQGKFILVDPTEIEERIADGCYVMGINAHQEICFVHRRGVLLLQEEAVQRCENAAVRRAQIVTQLIRGALDDDNYKRATNAPIGFTNMLKTGTILGAKRPMPEVDLDALSRYEEHIEPDIINVSGDAELNGEHESEQTTSNIEESTAKLRAMRILQQQPATVFEGGASSWLIDEGEENESSDSAEENDTSEIQPTSSASLKKERESDSEEDAVFVNEDQVDVKTPGSRGWYTKDPFF